MPQAHLRLFVSDEWPRWLKCDGTGGAKSLSYMLGFFSSAIMNQKQISDLKFKGGRGQTALFTYNGSRLVLRNYLRGGLWSHVSKDKFCKLFKSARRAELEFLLCERMLRQGLPVPVPQLGLEITTGMYLSNALITLQIENSLNVAEIMEQRPLRTDELALMGSTLALFFKAGVVHTDLNIRNILLTDAQCYLIDFDKCYMQDSDLESRAVQRMLSRLQRSFFKEKALRPDIHFEKKDFEALRQACLTALG